MADLPLWRLGFDFDDTSLGLNVFVLLFPFCVRLREVVDFVLFVFDNNDDLQFCVLLLCEVECCLGCLKL